MVIELRLQICHCLIEKVRLAEKLDQASRPMGIAPIKIHEKVSLAVWNNLFSSGAKQLGRTGETIGEFIYSLCAPLRLGTWALQTVEQSLLNASKAVPEARRAEPRVDVLVPLLNQLPLHAEQSEVRKLFETLLVKTIDRDQTKKVHPSFVKITSELSRDEAILIKELYRRSIKFEHYRALDPSTGATVSFSVQNIDLSADLLDNFEFFGIYFQHLSSFGIVRWPTHDVVNEADKNGKPIAQVEKSILSLSEFGVAYASACLAEAAMDRPAKRGASGRKRSKKT